MDDFTWDEEWSEPRNFNLAEQIEARLGAVPLDDMLRGSPGLGATRFILAPEFMPECVVTCLWKPASVAVEFLRPKTCILEPGSSNVPLRVRRRCFRLPLALMPSRIRGWNEVTRTLAVSSSCSTLSFGGAFCWHRSWNGNVEQLREWINPNANRHRHQCEIIDAYFWLVMGGSLLSLLPGPSYLR